MSINTLPRPIENPEDPNDKFESPDKKLSRKQKIGLVAAGIATSAGAFLGLKSLFGESEPTYPNPYPTATATAKPTETLAPTRNPEATTPQALGIDFDNLNEDGEPTRRYPEVNQNGSVLSQANQLADQMAIAMYPIDKSTLGSGSGGATINENYEYEGGDYTAAFHPLDRKFAGMAKDGNKALEGYLATDKFRTDLRNKIERAYEDMLNEKDASGKNPNIEDDINSTALYNLKYAVDVNFRALTPAEKINALNYKGKVSVHLGGSALDMTTEKILNNPNMDADPNNDDPSYLPAHLMRLEVTGKDGSVVNTTVVVAIQQGKISTLTPIPTN